MSGSALFSTEPGNPFGNQSSDASSSQDSELSSIDARLYSQPEQSESMTQVYHGPDERTEMTRNDSNGSFEAEDIGSHDLLGKAHDEIVSTPQSCDMSNEGATSTHEPPEIEIVRENLKFAFQERILAAKKDAGNDAGKKAGKEAENDVGKKAGKEAEKKAGKEAENEGRKDGGKETVKETVKDIILEQNDANFKLALVSAGKKKQDNKESRKEGSTDLETESANNDISPPMPSILFVLGGKTTTTEKMFVAEKIESVKVCGFVMQNLKQVGNPPGTSHVPGTLALTAKNLDHPDEPKAEKKAAKPTTPDEPKVEEKVAKPKVEEKVAKSKLKRYKSHVVVHPEARRVVKSVLKGTEEFDADIVRKDKEFKRKNAEKMSEKKQNREGAKGGKGKMNESKGTFQAKKVAKKSKEISSDKSVEVDKGKSDVEKDGEIFLADVLGDIDIQEISHEEGLLLFERLQPAQVSCENILRCLKTKVKSLTASIPEDEDKESENQAKIEESQAKIIEYTARVAEFARVMNPLSKKLLEHSDKELERSANSVNMVGGLVTKPRDEMDCSDPLFWLDNVHDKAPEDGEGSAQGSGANALKKRKNKDTGKKAKGSRDDEGKKRKIESDETPEADNSLDVKMLLYTQIRRLERDVSIYKDSSMLNLQEKERKATENTLLKNKVRELTSKLEGVENDNSKTITQNGKLEKEVERLKASKAQQNSSLNDRISAQMDRESALDARIDQLEEELKSKGESLKAVERALEETRAVVNAANSVVDAVKASSEAPKIPANETKVTAKIPANETKAAAKIPANETKAAAKNAAREEKAAAKEAKRLEQFQPSHRVICKMSRQKSAGGSQNRLRSKATMEEKKVAALKANGC